MIRNTTKAATLLATLLLAAPLASANAIDANSLASVTQWEEIQNGLAFDAYTQAGYVSNQLTANVESYADLGAGKVGALSGNANAKYSASASIFDTIRVDIPSVIFYDFTLDGYLSANYDTDVAYGIGGVFIYDITGLDTWLVEKPTTRNSSASLVSIPLDDSRLVSYASTEQNLNSMWAQSNIIPFFQVSRPLARDGTPHLVEQSLIGLFEADPTKTYGLQVFTTSLGGFGATADFLNTGFLNFFFTGGATIYSSSGLLPGTVPLNPVPEPPIALMFGLGMIGLLFAGRRASRF